MMTGPYESTFADLLDALKGAPAGGAPAPGAASLMINGRAFPATAAQAASGAYPATTGSTMTGSVSPGAGFERPAPAIAPGYSARNVTPGANVAPASLLPRAAAPASSPGLVDPNGNPQTGLAALPFNVRSAMLKSTFGLDKGAATALTNNLYLHPENAGVLAGTHLDPTVNADRRALTDLQLAQGGQHLQESAAMLPGQLALQHASLAETGQRIAGQAAELTKKTTPRTLETITLKDEKGNDVNFAWDGASAPQRIAVKPAAVTKDVAEKVQSALELAQQDLEAAQAKGDTKAAAAAQARVTNYAARMKSVTAVKGDGFAAAMDSLTKGPGGAAVAKPVSAAKEPMAAAVPAAAIAHLKANPKLAADFDAKYGAGAAAKALGAK